MVARIINAPAFYRSGIFSHGRVVPHLAPALIVDAVASRPLQCTAATEILIRLKEQQNMFASGWIDQKLIAEQRHKI